MDELLEGVDEKNASIKDVIKMLKKMHLALDFLSGSHEEFKNKIQNLEEENKKQKIENSKMNKRIGDMEKIFFKQEQQSQLNTFTIHGIPRQKNEELKNTIIKAAKVLKVEMNIEDMYHIM